MPGDICPKGFVAIGVFEKFDGVMVKTGEKIGNTKCARERCAWWKAHTSDDRKFLAATFGSDPGPGECLVAFEMKWTGTMAQQDYLDRMEEEDDGSDDEAEDAPDEEGPEDGDEAEGSPDEAPPEIDAVRRDADALVGG